MDLEAFPFDLELMLMGEAVDTRLANEAERSDEVGVHRYAGRHGLSVSPDTPGYTPADKCHPCQHPC